MNQFERAAVMKAEKAVSRERKSLTVKFSCLFNAKSLTVSQKLNRGFSREFGKVHTNNLAVRNLRCKVTIKGFSIGEDLGGKTSTKLNDVRREFEKATGLHISAFDARYEQVDASQNEMPNWTFDFTFYEVDPADVFSGTVGWELYR